MNRYTPEEIVGLNAFKESFFVFLIFGCLVIVYGHSFHDLNGELPDDYMSLLSEPLSIRLAFTLSSIGLLISTALRLIAGDNIFQNYWINNWLMAISRAGLAAGGIVSGMLTGAGSALCIISELSYPELMETAQLLLGLGFLNSLFTATLLFLHLYIVYPWRQRILMLDASSALLLITTVIFLMNFNVELAWNFVFLELFILIGYVVFLRKSTMADRLFHRYRLI